MHRSLSQQMAVALVLLVAFPAADLRAADSLRSPDSLSVGFAKTDITPRWDGERPVYLAGYLPGRQAEGVHDPLAARGVVLQQGDRKLAFVSVDLIGLQLETVDRIRKELKDYDHVTVASTHNHSGPDVIGIWGKSFLRRGVDDEYIRKVVRSVIECVRLAEKKLEHVRGRFGTADDDKLVHDSRLPIVVDPTIRVLEFTRVADGKPAGLLVQWSCHPESLRSSNRQLTADFPAAVVATLEKRRRCPVVYFSGAVGGLMAPPHQLQVGDRTLQRGTWEFCRAYGERVAELALQAVRQATPLSLTPLRFRAEKILIPVRNPWYRAARLTGVVRRKSYAWTGDPLERGRPMKLVHATRIGAIESEVGYWQLGELGLAMIPGELYPELLEGKIDDPPQADYPDSPHEPSIEEILPTRRWMLAGLANDEIGYLIPARQWDARPPFAYGKRMSQYGEINSCGPDSARIVLESLARCTDSVTKAVLAKQ